MHHVHQLAPLLRPRMITMSSDRSGLSAEIEIQQQAVIALV